MSCQLLRYHHLDKNVIRWMVRKNKLDLIKYFITLPKFDDISIYQDVVNDAIFNNHIRMVDFLINIPDVIVKNSYIHWSVYLNKIEIVQLLLDKPGVIDYIKRIPKDMIESIETIRQLEVNIKIIELLKSIE